LIAQQLTAASTNIVVDSYSLEKSRSIPIGVLVELEEGWHIYWRNSGDSGIPTEIEFALPSGVTVSEIEFPIPKIFVVDEIVNFGYDKQVLFTADLFIPENFNSDELLITAKLNSLICKDFCRPFDTTCTIKIDISKDYNADKNISKLFEETFNRLPLLSHNLLSSASSFSDTVLLKIYFDEMNSVNPDEITFFPYVPGVFKNTPDQKKYLRDGYLEIILEPAPFRLSAPDKLSGLVVVKKNENGNQSDKAFEITVSISN
jgi:thiol:disulfide interchange protein DsbD